MPSSLEDMVVLFWGVMKTGSYAYVACIALQRQITEEIKIQIIT